MTLLRLEVGRGFTQALPNKLRADRLRGARTAEDDGGLRRPLNRHQTHPVERLQKVREAVGVCGVIEERVESLDTAVHDRVLSVLHPEGVWRFAPGGLDPNARACASCSIARPASTIGSARPVCAQ